MTKEEFEFIIRVSIDEAIVRAPLYLRLDVPKENIRLITHVKELANGWEASVQFLTEHMYLGEQSIKPCADLVVEDLDENTTTIRLHISGHKPRPYCTNWSGGVGPFIKAINMKLVKNKAQSEFP